MALFIFSFLKTEGIFVTEDAQPILTKIGVSGLEQNLFWRISFLYRRALINCKSYFK
jgi:hypothetical protein